jgi:hypothetical protein
MVSTHRTKDDFLNALSSQLEEQRVSVDIRSALLSGFSAASDRLSNEEPEQSQAFHLKLGAWIIRDEDIPLLQAISATATAVALSLTTAGLAWPSIATALTSLTDVCWRAWRKGGRLSPQQVSVYGCLDAFGPSTCDSLLVHLPKHGKDLSADALVSTLESLTEIELNDGRIIALASQNANAVWRALKI